MQREALNVRTSLARCQRLPHKVRDISAWIQNHICAASPSCFDKCVAQKRQLREWRPFAIHGKLPPSTCPAKGSYQLLLPSNLFPFPIFSPLHITQHLRQQPCFTLLLATSLLSSILCASCSVDHLLCSLQGYLHCTSFKANLVKSRLQPCSPLPSTRSVVSLFEQCHSLPSPF